MEKLVIFLYADPMCIIFLLLFKSDKQKKKPISLSLLPQVSQALKIEINEFHSLFFKVSGWTFIILFLLSDTIHYRGMPNLKFKIMLFRYFL